jgi:mediator of RNA polymerase II transcription subunit 28
MFRRNNHILIPSQSCLSVLTKEEVLPTMEKDEIRVEVDHTILRFIDLARQMEAFFLQKRFLLSALKPELVVKEVSIVQV